MTIEQIKTAVDNGEIVHAHNSSYTVIKDKVGQYLIHHINGSYIGLYGTYLGVSTLNMEPDSFYIENLV